MKADFYRYICECCPDEKHDEYIELTKATYEKAEDYSLAACSPTKLALVLNHSVFTNE